MEGSRSFSGRWDDGEMKNAFENACREDSDFKELKDTVESGIGRAFKAEGATGNGLSLNVLQKVIAQMRKIDERLAKRFRETKNIWRNEEVLRLVERYFKTGERTKNFYDNLIKLLDIAAKIQKRIQRALQYAPHQYETPCVKRYRQFRAKLHESTRAENPFNEEFTKQLLSIRKEYEDLLEELKAEEKKLARKYKHRQMVRKIFNFIFGAAFATAWICSIVVAVMTAAPLVVPSAVTASISIGSIGEWLDAKREKNDGRIKEQGEIVEAMRNRTDLGFHQLNVIGDLVKELQTNINSILESEINPDTDEDTQQIVLEDIVEKNESIKNQIDALHPAVDKMKELQKDFRYQIDNLRHELNLCKRQILENGADIIVKKNSISSSRWVKDRGAKMP